MKSSVTGRHIDVTPALRDVIAQNLAKLERLLNDNAISVQVVLTQAHRRYCAEVVLHVRGDHMLHGDDEGESWSQAIGGAVEKVSQQAYTLRSKWDKRRRSDTR